MTSLSKLKILYSNADSISNKKDELEYLINQKNIDVALICETEPKNSSLPAVPLIIEGYDVIENKDGRGVMIIYREHIDVTPLKDINKIFSPAIFIKISNPHSFINLGISYRSPNNPLSEDIKQIKQIKTAATSLKNLFIYGDFNYPEVDWVQQARRTLSFPIFTYH